MEYEEIVNKVKKVAIKKFDALDKANTSVGNRQNALIWKTFENIQGDSELCRKILLELIESDESSVRVTAAQVMLNFGIDIEKAEKVLVDESEKGGVVAVSAYTSLYIRRDSKISEL